jgi:hypothetical protein
MDTKDVIEKLQAIQNSFIGYEPGTGFMSAPGPSSDVRIARAVYSIEGLERELSDGTNDQEPPADGEAGGSSS